jgi:hypothetical protein
MCQHSGHCFIDGTAEAAALRGNIDERDRPLVKAGVLIHATILTRSDPK